MIKFKREVLSKSELFSVIVYWLVRLVSIGVIVFAIVALGIDLHQQGKSSEEIRTNSRYIYMIVQGVSMIALTLVPYVVKKIWKIAVPVTIELCFLAFCAGSVICGEVFKFYVKFDWWDDMLHAFSGFLIATIGYVIISAMNESDNNNIKLSAGFVAWFSFFLAMSCESIWEVFEYTCDGIFGGNMQRYKDNFTLVPFTGRGALADTMSDIIEVMIGSIILCVVCYIDMKFSKKTRIVNHLKFRKVKYHNEKDSSNESLEENNTTDNVDNSNGEIETNIPLENENNTESEK